MLQIIYKHLKYLGVQRKACENIGLDIMTKNEDEKVLKNPLLFFVPLIGGMPAVFALIVYIYDRRSDIEKAAEAMSMMIPICLSIAKACLLLLRADGLSKSISDLESLVDQDNAKCVAIWRNQNKFEQIFSFFYYLACWGCTISLFARPFLVALSAYLRNGEVELSLPLPGIYPYDETKLFFYVLTYLFSVLHVYFIRNGVLSVECLFCWHVFIISGHCEAMRAKYVDLSEPLNEQSSLQKESEFKRSIQAYQRIINCVTNFNDLFQPIIFIQVIVSSLQLCLFAYTMGNAKSLNSETLFVFFAISAVILQIIFYCFGGQKIENECESIEHEMYLSVPWENFRPKVRRDLVISLLGAQKVRPTSGYFFKANNSLFTSIMRATSSFTAFIRAVEGTDDNVSN